MFIRDICYVFGCLYYLKKSLASCLIVNRNVHLTFQIYLCFMTNKCITNLQYIVMTLYLSYSETLKA